MVEVAGEVVSCSRSVALVTDHHGFVIEPLDIAIIDGHVEPSQDILKIGHKQKAETLLEKKTQQAKSN